MGSDRWGRRGEDVNSIINTFFVYRVARDFCGF